MVQDSDVVQDMDMVQDLDVFYDFYPYGQAKVCLVLSPVEVS